MFKKESLFDGQQPEKAIIPPFLKWAGGKRWLVLLHSDLFKVEFNRYVEPFLGSGAVFFHLAPQKAILSDSNSMLIDTFTALKDDWQKVYAELIKHNRKHSKDYYYEIRKSKPRKLHTKAAKFIYLNRTCWNGLYRVNRNGDFNVPIGTKNNVILESDDFESVSQMLSKAKLIASDFEKSVDMAIKDDLLFVDPPYTVNHNKNGFLKYNESIFSWDDQVRLSECLKRANRKGVKVFLTNADHKSVRDLYKDDFRIKKVRRGSVIAGSPRFRGTVTELLVLGNM